MQDRQTTTSHPLRRAVGAGLAASMLAASLVALPIERARAVVNDFPRTVIEAEIRTCMALTAKTPGDLHRCMCKFDVIGERLRYSEFSLTKQAQLTTQARTALAKLATAVQEANQVCI